MSESTAYLETGRTRQKARTRAALLDAVRSLLAQGVEPTVENAAALAGISRATAYRYFPSQRDLVVAAHPEVEARTLLGDDAPADPEERLEAAVHAFVDLVLKSEAELRTMLRLSLEPGLPSGDDQNLVLRRGRAIRWFEEALSPLHDTIGAEKVRRIAVATRAACGIETLVWLTDVAGLSRQAAVEVMRSSARAVFRDAIASATDLSGRWA